MSYAPPRRLALKQIDATASLKSTLLREHCARIALDDGSEITLHAGAMTQALQPSDEAPGLPLQTRFGQARLFDYEPFLLACTGVDLSRAETPCTREAFARYGLAALPAELFTAFGEPMLCSDTMPSIAADECAVLGLRCAWPTLRLTMRMAGHPDVLLALLERAPWQPVSIRAAPWLSALRTGQRLVAGELMLPTVDYRRLACGSMIRLPSSAFDVQGRAKLTIAARALDVQWLSHQHAFEVQRMSSGDALSQPHPHPQRSESSADLALADTQPAALPVRLSFVIGTLAMPYGEVAALAIGSLLKLDAGLPPTVQIEANGVPVGYGELVDFDGRLAVEITQWPQASRDPQTP